ncbi:MAG: hypothetical protein ACYCXJ_00895 [Thermoleophilia bacterium]
MDLQQIKSGELLKLSREVLDELLRRELIRTGNAPAGDYAELLVRQATGGELARNSRKSWDVKTSDERIQVKSRFVINHQKRNQRQLSAFRSVDFDVLIIVLFERDFSVWQASRVSVEILKAELQDDLYVGGRRLYATDEFLEKGDTSWTSRLQAAEKQLLRQSDKDFLPTTR